LKNENPIEQLIKSLSVLPGVGEKTATRLALHIMNMPENKAVELAESIKNAREKICLCSECFNYSDSPLCFICTNPSRRSDMICVVETPGDIISIEKSGGFKGKYHVLHGVISPLDGIGPDQIKIKDLLKRAGEQNIKEVVLATNPTMNGNATALYISEQLKPLNIKVSRIAQGIQPGGDIGYADQGTLRNALDGRIEMK
jgi:recombination protein RecR